MNISKLGARLVVTGLLVALPVGVAWSAYRSEAEQAIEEAEAARATAASVGGEWRDTAKLIKEAESLLPTRQYTKAIEIANKAKRQGELGYEQAMQEQDADFPDFMRKRVQLAKAASVSAAESTASTENRITPTIAAVEVMHDGEPVTITRGHSRDATLPEEFAKTDRGCPPFCVQPMTIAEGVETIGEIEMLEYLKRVSAGDDSVLVVDSRTPDWVMRGTIPGAVNVPWNLLSEDSMAGMFGDSGDSAVDRVLVDRFGAYKGEDGQWSFADARTLVLFCNGIW
jgi:rhodanese-related sulfurtransferase